MNGSATKDYIVIGITLLIGMILTLIPMPPWAVWLRPNWMLAIMIFWLMTASHRVGIGMAWFVGLFMDLLTGTLLGQQALIFCITAYFSFEVSTLVGAHAGITANGDYLFTDVI